MSMLDAALEIAADGCPVFPCAVNGKSPLTPNGYKDATTDVETIRAWWTENPDANIGASPEAIGLCVVDIDIGASPDDIAKLPATYTVDTPSGGKHLYYEGSLPPSASKIALKIDTRGRGSYVLLPPSKINGKEYAVTNGQAPVKVPQEIIARINRVEAKAEAVTDKLDLSVNLNTATGYLANQITIQIGEGQRNNRCYEVAAKLYDYGLSPTAVMGLMAEFNSKACTPPLDGPELATIVSSAGRNRQNSIGSKAAPEVRDPNEVFAKAELPVEVAKPSRYTFRDPVEEANRKPIECWDADKLFQRSPEGSTVIVYGDTGVFKTSFLLSFALDALFNHPAKPRIAFYAGEGAYGVGQARIPAACRHLGKTVEELRDTGRWGKSNAAPLLTVQKDLDEVRAQLDTFKPDIVIIETLSRSLSGLNLSDTQVITQAIAVADAIRDRHHALVIITHHQGKDEGRGASGSKQIVNMPDTVLHITKVDADTIKVFVEKQRDGADEYAAGFRVIREGEVPAFLAPIAKSELRKTDAKAIEERNNNSDYGARRDTLLKYNMVGAERGRTTADFARLAAGPPPERSTDAYDTWEANYAKILADLKNGSRADRPNQKYGGLFERLPRESGDKLIVLWFISRAMKDHLDAARATAETLVHGVNDS